MAKKKKHKKLIIENMNGKQKNTSQDINKTLDLHLQGTQFGFFFFFWILFTRKKFNNTIHPLKAAV